MNKLIIFPFNGNGIEAIDCIRDQFELIGFVDDTAEKQGVSEFGIPVHDRKLIENYPEAFILAVPGGPLSYKYRKSLINSLKVSNNRFAKVIHPKAVVADYASVGFNSLIMAGVVITNKAKIGNHVCILPNSVIHHDSVIGDYTLIGSQVVVAGNTEIGTNCYLGSGSSIINGIKIGSGCLVGMGSNVIKSFPADVKLAGNPAKIL